jgi:beta-N-acetylhexosaminidase
MTKRGGELLMVGFHGTELPDWLLEFEAQHGLGGVILFDRDLERKTDLRNIESPEQVRALCESVHALPSRPLVFIDQEGGRVRRLKPARGFAELPSAAQVGAGVGVERESNMRALIEASYAEMAALGIDLNLAPVVDLNTNPDNPNIGAIERSFSADAAEVRRCVAIYCEAATKAGLQLCLKHYPGLGGATTDSHSAITDISTTISDEQLALFFELCAEIPGAAILVSHGLVRDWDPDWPASISKPAIGRLRKALPDALLITDDIQMQGFQAFCPTLEGSLRAIEAGIDLVCIGNNLRSEAGQCSQVAEQLEARAAENSGFRAKIEDAIGRIAIRKDTRSL